MAPPAGVAPACDPRAAELTLTLACQRDLFDKLVALSASGRAIAVFSGKARVFDGMAWGATETITAVGVTMPILHPVAVAVAEAALTFACQRDLTRARAPRSL